ETEVDAGAERQLRGGALLRDVEVLGRLPHVMVEVAAAETRRHERPGGEPNAAVLDVLAGDTHGAADGAEVAHRLLDGAPRQTGVVREHRPLVGVLTEQRNRARELV